MAALSIICTILPLFFVSTQAVPGLFGAPALAPIPPIAPVAMPVMFQFANNNRERPAPETMTCISKDDDDASSQIRLTLSPTRRGSRRFSSGMHPMGAAFGDDFTDNLNDFADNYQDNFNDLGEFGDFDFDDGFFPLGGGSVGTSGDGDRVGEFRVDGTFIPSMSEDKAGTYQVVVTQYGRTSDGCSPAALGNVYSKPRNNGINAGFGGVGMGLGMGYGMQAVHPLGSFSYHKTAVTPFVGPYSPSMYGMGGFWNQASQQQQQRTPVGLMSNPAIVAGSATIFSAHLEGVSKNELMGRGIALCQSVQNGVCQGYIPFCCTITRDRIPAMELFVQSEELIDTERGDTSFPINFGVTRGNSGMNNVGMGINQAIGGSLGGSSSGSLFK